jgi:hypothetical protein
MDAGCVGASLCCAKFWSKAQAASTTKLHRALLAGDMLYGQLFSIDAGAFQQSG